MEIESEERFIPEGSSKKLLGTNKVEKEHYARYNFVSKFVKNKKVLDIACGSGYGINILKSNYPLSITGADADLSTVNKLRNKFKDNEKINLLVIDANNFNSTELTEKKDVIASLETIEHLKNPDNFLSGIKRNLANNGIVIISTPNRNVSNPGTTINDKPKNQFHIREYDRGEFLILLKKYFKEVEIFGQGRYFKIKNKFLFNVSRKIIKLIVLFDSGMIEMTDVKKLKRCHEPAYFIAVCK